MVSRSYDDWTIPSEASWERSELKKQLGSRELYEPPYLGDLEGEGEDERSADEADDNNNEQDSSESDEDETDRLFGVSLRYGVASSWQLWVVLPVVA